MLFATIPEAVPPVYVTAEQTSWDITNPADLARVRVAMASLAAGGEAGTPEGPLLATTAERLGVVFSELATNALRHGTAPVTAALTLTARGWLLVVSDAGPWLEPRVRPLSTDRAGGYGLRLVLRLSNSAGWYCSGTQKSVWALIADRAPSDLLRDLNAETVGDPAAAAPLDADPHDNGAPPERRGRH